MAGDPIDLRSTRVFEAESFTFTVRSDDRKVLDAVEILFSDLSTGQEPADEFLIWHEHDGFRAKGPDTWLDEGIRDGDTILSELVTAVNRKRLDAGASRLHLHAGLVARDGVSVLIAGTSGAGKSTLVTSLTLRGWVYLTDETASVALADPSAHSFPKPVTLKNPGDLFPELADHRVTLGSTDMRLWHVPLGRTGASTATAAAPSLVILLSRGTTPIPSWEPLRPADAVVELVEETLDLERYGDDALLTLAELCSRSRCVQIESGTPESTALLVEELAADALGDQLEVARLNEAPGSSVVDRDVIAVAIGDEAVLRHRGTGQVISLNSAAAEIWRMVASADFGLGALRSEQVTFVRNLASLGFVQLQEDTVKPDDF